MIKYFYIIYIIYIMSNYNLEKCHKIAKYGYRLKKSLKKNNIKNINEYYHHFKHHIQSGGENQLLTKLGLVIDAITSDPSKKYSFEAKEQHIKEQDDYINELAQQMAMADDKITGLLGDIQRIQLELVDKKTELTQIEDFVNSFISTYIEMEGVSISSSDNILKKIQTMTEMLDSQIARQQQKKKDCRKKIIKIQETLNDGQVFNSEDEINPFITTIKDRLVVLERENKELTNSIAEKQASLVTFTAAKTDASTINAGMIVLEEQKQRLELKIVTLETQLAQKDQEIRNMQDGDREKMRNANKQVNDVLEKILGNNLYKQLLANAGITDDASNDDAVELSAEAKAVIEEAEKVRIGDESIMNLSTSDDMPPPPPQSTIEQPVEKLSLSDITKKNALVAKAAENLRKKATERKAARELTIATAAAIPGSETESPVTTPEESEKFTINNTNYTLEDLINTIIKKIDNKILSRKKAKNIQAKATIDNQISIFQSLKDNLTKSTPLTPEEFTAMYTENKSIYDTLTH